VTSHLRAGRPYHSKFLLPLMSSSLRPSLLIAFAASVLMSVPLTATAATGSKPNILYILADDLGYGDVQALNPRRGKIRTPHLDRLAREGMTFTDAHSGSSVCTPTRYGLLTGRYAWRTVLQRGVLDGTNNPPLIAADRLTVAGLLKQHGYTTAAIGKWHLGFTSELPAGTSAPAASKVKGKTREGGGGLPVGARIIGGPTSRGFDYFWGCSNARTMSGLIENERVIENLAPIAMLPRLGHRAVSYIAERAAAARNGQPFFLYLPLTSPHTPIVPTPEWQGKSGLNAYADFTMQTDAVVGDVLTALAKNGLADNTLVIFTADNGCAPQAGTPALEQQGHFASGDFRGYKADIWEGGHRVPFFARWPGRVKAGTKSKQVICHTDFIATVAEMLGARLPANAGEDSVSILPALLGNDRTPLREAVVHHSIDGRFAIRAGDWKLALCPGSGGWAAPKDADAAQAGLPDVQLYDLVQDIGETRNLAREKPEVVAQLTRLLERYVAEGRSTPGPKQPNDVAIKLIQPDRR
jgi:arylsulfatase A